MMQPTTLWRRLDAPGHDACRLERFVTGWQLEGTAVFLEGGQAARITYRVACDANWHALFGEVRGWVGADVVDITVIRTAGVWSINGAVAAGIESCVDLDFGFTPATNLPQLRRLDLPLGQAADAPAAWFDLSTRGLTLLPQRYERRGELTYWYKSPTTGYEDLLEVDAHGFIRHYPGLWQAEAYGEAAADRYSAGSSR